MTERSFPLSQAGVLLRHSVPNRFLEQTRLSILSWNPGPRHKKTHCGEMAAIEYLQHECLTNHFYVTHYAGCAGPLTSTTTENGQDQAVREGQSGFVLQVVISCASFQRILRNGVLIYHDVAPYQQRLRQHTRNREEFVAGSPY